ncbi:MAG TPA: alpha/beta hydrolase [Tepidisphaeraceae bacterium]|jgi:alpha-L-fucosidase 2|nr:alpha/beta hydrolase [Tepidisphaeraceae bacterium]
MRTIVVLLAAVFFGGARVSAGVETDVEYAKAGDVSLKLDVNVPDGDGRFPVAILVHGGGWATGDKAGLFHVPTDALTKAQFTWFSINYRLAPKYRWPACFDDLQTAIRWVKAHAPEYKGDPNRIALVGYSSGGQLACLAAVLAKDDTRVQAVVGLAPPTDLELDLPQRGGLSKSLQDLLDRPHELTEDARKILHSMSAINFAKPGLPPFFIMQGDADRSVPYQGSLNFVAKLKENGVRCEMVTLKGAPHNIGKWEAVDPMFQQKMVDWLAGTLGGNTPPKGGG